MNELLQKHGCANVFKIPEGLKELMSDIAREVLRAQPPKILPFISNYLSVLLLTREHGILSLRILEDLCDCKPTVSQHLLHSGFDPEDAENIAQAIKDEIENCDSLEGKEKVKELEIIDRVLMRTQLDEKAAAKVCQIARNAFRDYWYKKQLLKKELKIEPEQPWEVAVEHTLELYKKTKPSFGELSRATERIQAAYRGYHVRKNLLRHMKPVRKQKPRPKQELPGQPLDIADSREIDLGPVIDISVKPDNVAKMFDEDRTDKLGLHYDPMKAITHQPNAEMPKKHTRHSTFETPHTAAQKRRSSTHKRDAPTDGDAAARRRSRGVSVTSGDEDENLHKMISFAEVPPALIPVDDLYDGIITEEPMEQVIVQIREEPAEEVITEVKFEEPAEVIFIPEAIPETIPEAIPEAIPEVIPEAKPEAIPEAVTEAITEAPKEEVAVPETIAEVPTAEEQKQQTEVVEQTTEIPEAIGEDVPAAPRSDGDGESAATVPSAPATPTTTDAEEGYTTTEEEG